jgi:hypothetical protein
MRYIGRSQVTQPCSGLAKILQNLDGKEISHIITSANIKWITKQEADHALNLSGPVATSKAKRIRST